jgi:Transposase DDE domain
MQTIPQVAKALQAVLTTEADRAGRQTRFVQRESKVTGSIFTQTLAFGLLANPQASLDNLTQTTAALGVELSPQGLDQRFSHEAALCLEQVLTAAIRTVVTTDPVAIPLLERFNGVYLQDRTTIVLPPRPAEVWEGCGGSTDDGAAALKVQLQLDLAAGRRLAQLQDGRDSDRNSSLDLALPPGALRLADLGYWELERLAELTRRGVWWLSRAQATTTLQTADGRWWDLLALLAADPDAATLDLPVRLGKTAHLEARLLAQRVPQEVADQRRRRLRAAAREQGETVSAVRLALAAWTVFVTSIPPAQLTLAEAVVLGHARWQIELIFKLWKSQGQVDVLREVQQWRVLCEVYAKILGQIVQHWLLLVSCWQQAARSLTKAAQTLRLHVMGVAKAMRQTARLEEEIETIARCIGAGCRMNRRKKHPNTYQLLLDITEGVFA